MNAIAGDIGFGDGTVVPEDHERKEALLKITCAFHAAVDQRRRGKVDYDEIGFCAFAKLADLVRSAQRFGASERR